LIISTPDQKAEGVTVTPSFVKSLFCLGLKGCAKSLAGAARAARTYRDLGCGATGIHVVIIAVLNVALDALDMLTAAVVIVLSLFHVIVFLSFLAKNQFAEQ
jgi:hypothetical protein